MVRLTPDIDREREPELADRLGVPAAAAYEAGVAGALCDEATRQRLVAQGVASYS